MVSAGPDTSLRYVTGPETTSGAQGATWTREAFQPVTPNRS